VTLARSGSRSSNTSTPCSADSGPIRTVSTSASRAPSGSSRGRGPPS
jgi:hypothetical protein